MVEISGTTDLRIVERVLSSSTRKPAKKTTEPKPAEVAKPVDENRNGTRVPKSPEVINQEVDLLCRFLEGKFDENQIEKKFARVDLKFHEKRLKEMKFSKKLRECFPSLSTGKNRIEMDIFSADFKGENAADLIEVQVSVFDKKSKNKIFETGAHFELSSVVELPKKADANPAN